MEIIIIAFFTILGGIIGSFLNVVILRHNTGQGLDGRSGCFTCSKKLQWYELIPVVSYLIQKGRCLGCKSSISSQYPLVEILTAVLFGLAAWKELLPLPQLYDIFELFNLFLVLIIISLLVIISVYDLRHKIIPDVFSFAFAAVALARLVLFYQWNILKFPYIIDLVGALIVALPFVAIWYFSKGAWMGLGDGKLALGIGWFLGFSAALSGITLAFWIGAVVSVLILITQRMSKRRHGLSFKSEIPFAPFLIAGCLILYFIPMDFFHVDTFLMFLV